MARRPRSGRQPSEPLPPDRGANAAVFVAMTRRPPRSLVVGQSYEVAITMRNTGTSVWYAEGDHPYRLGAERPRDNTRWGIGRIDVPADIDPGDEVTFTFSIVAPSSPGQYHFQWRMVQDGVGWFGERSPDTVVTVDRPPTFRQEGRDAPGRLRRPSSFRPDLGFAAFG